MKKLPFYYGGEKMSTFHNIGEHLRYYRLQKGLSQEQLALISKVNTSYLGQIERGIKNPSVHILNKIASGLEITFEQLVHGHEYENVPRTTFVTILTKQELKQLMIEAVTEAIHTTGSTNT